MTNQKEGDFDDENMNNNPYDVLGISRTSSSEKARKVFLEKCKRLHPDKRLHGREEEEEVFIRRGIQRLNQLFFIRR